MHSKAVVNCTQVELTAQDLLSNFQRCKAAGRLVGLTELEEQILVHLEWSFVSVIRPQVGELLIPSQANRKSADKVGPSPYFSLCTSPQGEAEFRGAEITLPKRETPKLATQPQMSYGIKPISPFLSPTLPPASQPVSPLSAGCSLSPASLSPSATPDLSPTPVRFQTLHPSTPQISLPAIQRKLQPPQLGPRKNRVSAERIPPRSLSLARNRGRALALNGMAAITGAYGHFRTSPRPRLGVRE